MDKIDFKKKYKEVYKNKRISSITYPELQYITIDGEGAPSSKKFQEAIGALYATAYTISMSYKSDLIIKDFYNFVVPPLEGIWDLIDTSKGYKGNKDNLKWKIMIAMPEFVTKEVLIEVKKRAYDKKKIELIKSIELEMFKERGCCIALHIGSYDNEDITFKMMEDSLVNSEYKRKSKIHREIYLSDFRKVEEEKLKTILCFEIIKK